MAINPHADVIPVPLVKGCARCTGDHENLRFRKLARAMQIEQYLLTHWALCPVTREPILFAAETAAEIEAAPA